VNNKNLIPNSERSPKEVRENGRKGGIKSGQVRREQKTYREMAKAMLSAQITDPKMLEEMAKYGIEGTDLKAYTLLGMIKASVGGSHNAFDRLLELAGEKDTPTDQNRFNDGLMVLADLINNPAPNRNIADFEGDDDD
jgi:hypothetical protein